MAVAALTEPGHSGELYELTGPRGITFAEAVAEIARASGRDIGYRKLTTGQFAAGLAEQVGLEDPGYVEFLTYLFAEVLDGRNSRPADGVRRATGRAPRSFADYARKAAATGVWTA